MYPFFRTPATGVPGINTTNQSTLSLPFFLHLMKPVYPYSPWWPWHGPLHFPPALGLYSGSSPLAFLDNILSNVIVDTLYYHLDSKLSVMRLNGWDKHWCPKNCPTKNEPFLTYSGHIQPYHSYLESNLSLLHTQFSVLKLYNHLQGAWSSKWSHI